MCKFYEQNRLGSEKISHGFAEQRIAVTGPGMGHSPLRNKYLYILFIFNDFLEARLEGKYLYSLQEIFIYISLCAFKNIYLYFFWCFERYLLL